MRKLLIFVFVFVCWQAAAQEKLMPVMPVQNDSVQAELERQILYRQLLSGSLLNKEVSSGLQFPEFDLNTSLTQLRNTFNSKEIFEPGNPGTFSLNSIGFIPSPFFRNGTVFSGAIYRLNNKFNLGGYSFGANSIFSAPMPNQGRNNFDTRGATMFLQYKVSKNVRIETRVSVTQGNGPGF